LWVLVEPPLDGLKDVPVFPAGDPHALRRRRLVECQLVRALASINMRKVCAFGQKLLLPSTFPAIHLSQSSSRGHLLQRRRVSLLKAVVRGSSSAAVRGSRPTRFIIPIMRLAEAAAMLDRSHTVPATATPAMIIAMPICVGSIV
jgi:hypothetical protein